MAFAGQEPEIPQNVSEPRLSTASTTPLYVRRANRAAAIEDTPYYAPAPTNSNSNNNDNNNHPSGQMDLSAKMGAMEVAQPPPNSAVSLPMPAQRQVKELIHVIEAAEYAIRNQV
jgi:hypothetical protein